MAGKQRIHLGQLLGGGKQPACVVEQLAGAIVRQQRLAAFPAGFLLAPQLPGGLQGAVNAPRQVIKAIHVVPLGWGVTAPWGAVARRVRDS